MMESNISWQDQNGPPQHGDGGGACVRAPLPDTSGFLYPQNASRNVTAAEVAGKVGVTSLVIILALLGNCLVVTTVWRCRRLHTPTNVYIVSLAVSDLMVTLSCTWVHLVYLDHLTFITSSRIKEFHSGSTPCIPID